MIAGNSAMRRYLAAAVLCGAVIAAATVASACVLARVVAGVITDPAARTLGRWSTELLVLAGLWAARAVAQRIQAGLSQRAATATIGDMSARVLRSVTALSPQHLNGVRDEATVVVTRGLDGLRPYFTGYLPAVI